LEQQDREGAPAVGRAEIAALLQQLERDGGRRERDGDADDARRRRRQAVGEGRAADDERAQRQLRGTEPEDVAPHGDEPRDLEFEPDDEEQQHHADLGDARGRLRLGDQREARRPDHHTRHQVAEHRTLAEQAYERNADHRRRQEGQHRWQEAGMVRGARHESLVPRWIGTGEGLPLSPLAPLPRG
jgi:hypothetical protein